MVFRPIGKIRIFDDRGYTYLPRIVQKELGITGKGHDVPFFIGANIVLLVGDGVKCEDVIVALEVLKADIQLRWKAEEDAKSGLR